MTARAHGWGRRLVALAIVGCGAPQTLRVDEKGAIAGVVSDRPGVFADGATIVATRNGSEAGIAIADVTGRYRLELPAASYRIDIYYGSQTFEQVVSVLPGRTTVLDTITDPLARCAAANPLARAITSEDRDAVIAATLTAVGRLRTTTADTEPVSPLTPIVLPASATLAALPLAANGRLVPATVESLTADVARTHLPVGYLQVYEPRFEGACAVVSLAKGVIDPTPAKSKEPSDPGRWLVAITANGPVVRGEIEITTFQVVED